MLAPAAAAGGAEQSSFILSFCGEKSKNFGGHRETRISPRGPQEALEQAHTAGTRESDERGVEKRTE